MNFENMIVIVVELCMVILGSLMLYTHTKNRWLLALFVLLSVGTAIIGWSLGEAARQSLPIIMLYTIVAVEYSMVQMDRRIDALLKTGVKATKPPYKLILFIAVMLSGVVGALVTSPPSAMQSHIELVVAIVLIAVALVSRIIRILLRGYQATPKRTYKTVHYLGRILPPRTRVGMARSNTHRLLAKYCRCSAGSTAVLYPHP